MVHSAGVCVTNNAMSGAKSIGHHDVTLQCVARTSDLNVISCDQLIVRLA